MLVRRKVNEYTVIWLLNEDLIDHGLKDTTQLTVKVSLIQLLFRVAHILFVYLYIRN